MGREEVRTQPSISFVQNIAPVVSTMTVSYFLVRAEDCKDGACEMDQDEEGKGGGGEALHVQVTMKNVPFGSTVHRPLQSSPGTLVLSSLSSCP